MDEELNSAQHQLDDHLQAINENTSEIQTLFDFLQEMEKKIDTLTEKLERLQLDNTIEQKPITVSLTQMEKKVFLVLYTEQLPQSYAELAEKTELPLAVIPECLSSIIAKGIPLVRVYYKEKLYLKLAPKFKEIQAKEKIVNLSLQSFIE